jgi:hypothetical protein
VGRSVLGASVFERASLARCCVLTISCACVRLPARLRVQCWLRKRRRWSACRDEELANVCSALGRPAQPHCMMRVRSGFGGFGTYWVDALRAAGPPLYNTSEVAPVEHVAFNLALDDASRISGRDRPLLLSLGFHPAYLYGSGAIWKRIEEFNRMQRERQGQPQRPEDQLSPPPPPPPPPPPLMASRVAMPTQATGTVVGQRADDVQLSIVVATRNDDWGATNGPTGAKGGLVRRASLALLRMLEVADEVVLVDLNSPPNASGHPAPLIDRLPAAIRHSPRLRSIVVGRAECTALRARSSARRVSSETPSPMGKKAAAGSGLSCGGRFYETLARNVGIRAARGVFIASSNIDVMPPSRPVLSPLLRELRAAPWRAFVLERKESHLWREQMDGYVRRRRLELEAAATEAGAALEGEAKAAAGSVGMHGQSSNHLGPSKSAMTWCPPTTLCYRDAFARDAAPAANEGYPVDSIDDLHPNLVRVPGERSLSLASLTGLPADPNAVLNRLSLVTNCGDFQLAHRRLWAVSKFDEIGLSGRQFGDSALIATWLNCNATVSVPSNIHVLHLSHLHPHPRRTPSMWREVAFNQKPHFQLRRSSRGSLPGVGERTPEGRKVIVDVKGVMSQRRMAPKACLAMDL